MGNRFFSPISLSAAAAILIPSPVFAQVITLNCNVNVYDEKQVHVQTLNVTFTIDWGRNRVNGRFARINHQSQGFQWRGNGFSGSVITKTGEYRGLSTTNGTLFQQSGYCSSS